MTVDLYDKAPPNSYAFMLAHILPLADTPLALGAKRWKAGMPVPYRMIRTIPGRSDLISAFCKVRLHTFHTDFTEASHEADTGHRRMLLLADDPLYDVVMAGNIVANCSSFDVREEPHEEPYPSESTIVRFVSEYDLAMRFIPVAT